MAILESSIALGNETLVIQKFYKAGHEIIDPEMRVRLLLSLQGFANEMFAQDLTSFSFAGYSIVFTYRKIRIDDPQKEDILFMYSVVEKNRDETVVEDKIYIEAMNKILDQFITRFGEYYILSGQKRDHMRKFGKRIKKGLKGLYERRIDIVAEVFLGDAIEEENNAENGG